MYEIFLPHSVLESSPLWEDKTAKPVATWFETYTQNKYIIESRYWIKTDLQSEAQDAYGMENSLPFYSIRQLKVAVSHVIVSPNNRWRSQTSYSSNWILLKRTVIITHVFTHSNQGPVSRKPRKLFGPVKPFLHHPYLKTEKCIRLNLLVWKEPPFIFRICE